MGTIRDMKGEVMEFMGILGRGAYRHQVVVLKSGTEEICLPRELYDNIENGASFTHVFFEDEAQYKRYVKSHEDTLRIVSSSSSRMSDGRIHLVY